jgi:hypothetical protein
MNRQEANICFVERQWVSREGCEKKTQETQNVGHGIRQAG